MLFNSFSFALFFPIVFIVYWFVFNKNLKWQNTLLFIASYFFYACWDWRFMFLLLFSTLLDFFTGIKIEEDHKHKKTWLWLSICINVSFLFVFKYFNFFVASFAELLSGFHLNVHPFTLSIILPVGISFYTFHGLSYVIDLYNNKIKAEKNLISYAVFVSFFPLLVAGPIERATHLLPQVKKERVFNYDVAVEGIRLMIWGFFKKIMIADRIAVFVDSVYGDLSGTQGFPIVMAILLFACQLYLDFSAYSDIALGVGKLLGFDLFVNFKRPYFSTSFGMFWSRWHISLSSWFRDYVYIPLGGNRRGRFITIRNVLIVFAVSGLWHGASWNFVIWGVLNALFMIALDPLLNAVKNKPAAVHAFKILFVLLCWAVSLVFFRAKTLPEAMMCFKQAGFDNTESLIKFGLNELELKMAFAFIVFLFFMEALQEKNDMFFPRIWKKTPLILRWVVYIFSTSLLLFLGHYGNGNEHSFIYFQF